MSSAKIFQEGGTVTFGDALKSARKAAKMAQKALSVVVGIDQSAISQVENGHRNTLSVSTVAKIEAALGLSPGALAKHLPADHRAHDLLQTEVPDLGVVWGGPADEDVPAPEPGRTYKLAGRFPSDTFVVQVRGHSVHNWGVHDGDRVAVRRTEQPEEGALVVARAGNAYTLKACIGGRLYSFPKGAKEPKDLEPSEPCQMVGVMLEIVEGKRRAVRKPNVRPRLPRSK